MDEDEYISNTEQFYEIGLLCDNVKYPHITSSNLMELDNEWFISQLSDAHTLIVKGTKGMEAFEYIEKYVDKMSNIKSLLLHNPNAGLEYIPDEYLRHLNIDHLSLRGDISIEGIDKFTRLSHLRLDEELHSIDSNIIHKISTLSTLEITSPIYSIDQFRLPNNLKKLELLDNNLDHLNFTNELNSLTQLRVNCLYTKIEKMTNLVVLHVEDVRNTDFEKLKMWNFKHLTTLRIINLNSDAIDIPHSIFALTIGSIRNTSIFNQLSQFQNLKDIHLNLYRASFKDKHIVFPVNIESIYVGSLVNIYIDIVNLKKLEHIVLTSRNGALFSYDSNMYKYLNLSGFKLIGDNRTESKIRYEFFKQMILRNTMLAWPCSRGSILELAMIFTGLINMNMPPYVLLEIIDWLPIEEIDPYISQYHLKNHLKKIRLIENVQQSINKLYFQRNHS